jgi:hypothetical protein
VPRSPHPDLPTLSAFLDGEDLPGRAAVRAHVTDCALCAVLLRELAHADELLASGLPLECAAYRTLLSAEADGESGPEERMLLQRHVLRCWSCAAELEAWRFVDGALRAMPLRSPPPHVDRAIAGRARRRPGLALPRIAAGGGLAVATAALVVAMSLGSLPEAPQDAPPEAARQTVFVAALDQIVVNSMTGRVYVLQPQRAVVRVYDVATRELLREIDLGGQPVSIDLHEAMNFVYVLDAESKSIQTIDGQSNAVVARAPVNVSGRPTSLQVDQKQNRIVVGATATDGSAKGEVAMGSTGLTGASTVSTVEVTPQNVAFDTQANLVFVTGRDATLVLDGSTHATVDRIDGPVVGLAVSARGGLTALARNEDDRGELAFFGRSVPSVYLGGRAKAVTAVPSGGFAVLVESTSGSRIVLVTETGVISGEIAAAGDGRGLAFAGNSGSFAVLGAGGLTVTAPVAQVPAPTQSAEPAPMQSAEPTATQSAEPTATQSAPAEPSPSAAAPSSAAPSSTEPPSSAAQPAQQRPDVPGDAVLASQAIYRLDVQGGRVPSLLVSGGRRIIFVDADRWLNAIDTRTGAVTALAQLPSAHHPTLAATFASRVYLFDRSATQLLVFWPAEGRFTEVAVPLGTAVVGMTIAPNGHLWFATRAQGLLHYDTQTGAFALVKPEGVRDVGVVFADPSGRVWFGGAGVVGHYEPSTGRAWRLEWPESTNSFGIDRDGIVWAGTEGGHLVGFRSTNIVATAGAPGRIERLISGPGGDGWFVSRSSASVTLGRAADGKAASHAQPSAREFVFDDLGRAWYSVNGHAAFFLTESLGSAR